MNSIDGAINFPHRSSSGRRTFYITASLLAVVILVGVIYRIARGAVEVKVASPTYQNIESTLSTTGTVVPLRDFPARANFSGIVEKIYVEPGQHVHAGELLLTMKDQYALSRLESARAELDTAEVNEDNVRMNGSLEDRISFAADLARAQSEQESAANALTSLKELGSRGSVSEAEVMAGTQRLENANTTLRALSERSRRRYSAKDTAAWAVKVAAAKAALDAEKVSYSNAHITSPISGTVYAVPVSAYDFVPVGADLLRVADLNTIQIHADFDEVDVGRLHSGQAVKISWDGRPARSWHGHIVRAPLAVTRGEQRSVGQCAISVEDAREDLPANSHVSVFVTTDTRFHVLTIPREALYTSGSAHYVYRIATNELVKTPVTIGLVTLSSVEIIGGLSPKDVIALHPLHDETLLNHLKVKVAN